MDITPYYWNLKPKPLERLAETQVRIDLVEETSWVKSFPESERCLHLHHIYIVGNLNSILRESLCKTYNPINKFYINSFIFIVGDFALFIFHFHPSVEPVERLVSRQRHVTSWLV